MSAPTRIYLVTVGLVALLWVIGATVIGAGNGELVYRGDMRYIQRNADRLPVVLRGRVVLRDRAGASLAVPPSTLTVAVNARATRGSLAVRRVEPVDETGVFEIIGLPEGDATVAVQLGGGTVVWQEDGIVLDRQGVFDSRLDPIDLGDRLFSMTLAVIGPTGDPVESGHLVWRATDEVSDDRSFEGDAPIQRGRATFLTTSPMVDVVTLVPGAEPELFEGLWGEEELQLAPGIVAVVRPTGQVPSPDEWSLRVALAPAELEPRIAYDEASVSERGALVVMIEDGVAEVPVARGGRYVLTWWAVPAEGQRLRTLRLSAAQASLDVPTVAGRHVLDVPFPIDEFTRDASSARR